MRGGRGAGADPSREEGAARPTNRPRYRTSRVSQSGAAGSSGSVIGAVAGPVGAPTEKTMEPPIGWPSDDVTR